MPETVNENTVFSLKEVAESIRKTIQQRYSSTFWVKAEMIRLNHYKYSGHCYPDLVEKADGRVIAQMRATLWASDFERINRAFLQHTGDHIRDGISILFKAGIQFDANHGLSLQIHDIDPVYLLGELEREKRETINKLKEENLFGKNALHPLPMLVKRIAVISVSTSKGLADFEQLLRDAADGFKFDLMLFSSLLQGEKAARQMEQQLERIAVVSHHFDAVAIIRGGGSDVGLTAFNNYRLAAAICRFPLPVLTGIGHATNLTVAEMVAHTHAITPSKLAETLIERFVWFNAQINRAGAQLAETRQYLRLQLQMLERVSAGLKRFAGSEVLARRNRLLDKTMEIKFLTRQLIKNESNRIGQLQTEAGDAFEFARSRQTLEIHNLEKNIRTQLAFLLQENAAILENLKRLVELSQPEKILKRGFSITYHKGKALAKASEVEKGDELKIRLANGRIIAIASEMNENSE